MDNINQKMTQSNYVGSSSPSHNQEMQVQLEKIVIIMWRIELKTSSL